MTTTDENSNTYNGVDALPYEAEMSFRYKNYNPETNTFTIICHLCDEERNTLTPYEWEHFDDKKDYERTDHKEKEKWILERAKEIVKAYEGYPDHVKDYAEVNKSKYEDYNFDEAELWIDYNERIVYIRLFCPKTGLDFLEYLNLDDIEEDYYERVESKFMYNIKGFKDDLNYFIDEYVKGRAEDFIDEVRDHEEEEEDYDIDTAIIIWIDSMKNNFTDWLQSQDEDYKNILNRT